MEYVQYQLYVSMVTADRMSSMYCVVYSTISSVHVIYDMSRSISTSPIASLMDTCARVVMLCLYVYNEAKALNDVNICAFMMLAFHIILTNN